jgi:fimbrial isopeptide formation D2 family protein/LPXTG-motif cell wall-anchored protein
MKLKRLFTAVLSAALALSLCAMPAMAADGAGTGTSSKTTTAIDWNQKGSLTIHKYETDTAPTGVHDNGESTTSGTPLNGVTFTLYKVQDDKWLKSYYQGTSTPAMPTVDKYVNTDGSLNTSTVTSTGIAVTTGDSTKGWADGTAVASGLDLGLYLVVETNKPDAVKQAAVPFLVSIPMTSVDKTSWLYDVTVNPKNVTKYGAATLKKVGYTGSKQDDTAMSGYTFKLYKWNGTAWNQITNKPKNGQDNMGDALGTLTTNDSGTISVDGLTQGVYAFVETGVNSTQGYILDAGTAYVFKLNDEGAMQTATTSDVASTANTFDSAVKTLNYDCVKPTTAGSTTNNLEVINYKPDFTKTVKDRKGNTSATHNADYAIGDKVPFVLTIQVPENIAKLKTFKVTDSVTPTQLAYSEDAVVMGTKNGETTETMLSAATDYTITYNAGKDGFTIDFKGTSTSLTAINDYAGKTITITYTATLQPGAAVVDDTTTNTVNKNSAELKYSNKTTVTGDTEDEKPYTIHEEAAVYTFKAGIHKTDGAGTDLDGVKFDLYKKYDANTDEADGTGVMYKDEHVAFLADAEATRLGLNAATGSGVNWYLVEKDLTTDTDGHVVVKGLPKGEYKFVETKTKESYNLLTKPVDANLNVDYKTAWRTDTTYDATTGTKTHSVTSTTYKVGNAAYTSDDIEVINRKGFTLPVTGGFGTLLFSGIGVLLVLAGVGVLFSLKKKSNRA